MGLTLQGLGYRFPAARCWFATRSDSHRMLIQGSESLHCSLVGSRVLSAYVCSGKIAWDGEHDDISGSQNCLTPLSSVTYQTQSFRKWAGWLLFFQSSCQSANRPRLLDESATPECIGTIICRHATGLWQMTKHQSTHNLQRCLAKPWRVLV